MKKLILPLFLACLVLIASCKKKEEIRPANTTDDVVEVPEEDVVLSGAVKGTLSKGVYHIFSDINVPENETLTLEPGVQFIFHGDGLSPETSPQVTVHGDLVANGSAAEPVLFSVPTDKRTQENEFAGFWGGIQCEPTSSSLVLRHVIMEYTGGPASQNSSSTGEYGAGDPRYALLFINPAGTVILENSIFRNMADDCFRPKGCKLAVVRCTFYNIGETGGEGLNIKDGTVGDVCYNTFFSIATNGIKPAGPGSGKPQSNINSYNNTIVNCGFRRAQSGRGGSINFENGCKGVAYNNLIVNCRFGIRLRSDDMPDEANTFYSNTHYYGNTQAIVDEFWPTADNNTSLQTGDIAGELNENNPMFVNYNVSQATNTRWSDAFNFRLQNGAPGLSAGKTNFTPVHSSLTAGGVTITIPGPSNYIGAFGN